MQLVLVYCMLAVHLGAGRLFCWWHCKRTCLCIVCLDKFDSEVRCQGTAFFALQVIASVLPYFLILRRHLLEHQQLAGEVCSVDCLGVVDASQASPGGNQNLLPIFHFLFNAASKAPLCCGEDAFLLSSDLICFLNLRTHTLLPRPWRCKAVFTRRICCLFCSS